MHTRALIVFLLSAQAVSSAARADEEEPHVRVSPTITDDGLSAEIALSNSWEIGAVESIDFTWRQPGKDPREHATSVRQAHSLERDAPITITGLNHELPSGLLVFEISVVIDLFRTCYVLDTEGDAYLNWETRATIYLDIDHDAGSMRQISAREFRDRTEQRTTYNVVIDGKPVGRTDFVGANEPAATSPRLYERIDASISVNSLEIRRYDDGGE